MSIFNSGLLLFIAFREFFIKYPLLIPLSVLATIVTMVLVGYLDVKWGFFRQEQLEQAKRNPALAKLLDKEVK